MIPHMGLGKPEEDFYPRRYNFIGGWVILALMMGLLVLAVLASTPAQARWQKACPWPCFETQAVKQVVKSKRDVRRVRKARISARRQIRPVQKRLARAKGQRRKRVVTRATGFVLKPKMIKALIRQESGGHCCRRSRAGALGKYQIMPRTARIWAASAGHPRLRRASYRRLKRALYTPSIARDIAKAYMRHYYRKYSRPSTIRVRRELVLIAYNGGPGRADQAAYCWRRHGYLCTYRRETHNYVKSIFRMAGARPAKMVLRRGAKRRYRKRRRRR